MGKILTKSKWTWFITSYTQELARHNRFKEALSILKFVMRSNVFVHDHTNLNTFRLYLMSEPLPFQFPKTTTRRRK